MRKHRTTDLGRDAALHGLAQFRDPVVLTRIGTVAIPLYLTVMIGLSVGTLAAACLVMLAGFVASTEFSRPDTYVERLVRARAARRRDDTEPVTGEQ